MSAPLLETITITCKIAGLATLLSALPSVSLGYFLSRNQFRGKFLVETLIVLPLVLPPSAIGYLILQLFAYGGWLGPDNLGFDPQILLSWKGAILAAGVMTLPLMTRTARLVFEEIDPMLEWSARSLGLSPWRTFLYVVFPLARRGLTAALALGFARAIGEFGATLIVAGSIPGETRTLSLAIYSAQETGRTSEANLLLLVALLFAFASVFIAEALRADSPSNKVDPGHP